MENSQLYIQRKADQYLAEWKANPKRLPLIVKGARQIGKTETILHFTAQNNENVVYINFVTDEKFKIISKDYCEPQSITCSSNPTTILTQRQVCCADKLSNCKAQLYDFKQIGDALFERFNKESTPELQAWYYKSIVKALSPLKGMQMYSELEETVKELYGL